MILRVNFISTLIKNTTRKTTNMIESLIALITAIVGLGIGYLVAKKINDAKYEIFVEQAKAKAKDAKNSILNAELEVKKKYEDKTHKIQKEFNQKFDELSKTEQKLQLQEESLKENQEELLRSKKQMLDLQSDADKLKKQYQTKLNDVLNILEHSAGLTQDEAKNIILEKVEENSRNEIAHIVRRYEEEARNEAK